MDVSSILFLYFVRASSLSFSLATSIFELQLHLLVHLCFGNAYRVVRKIQRQFNNVRIVCFRDFYLFIGNFYPVFRSANFYAYSQSFQCTFTKNYKIFTI